MKRLTGCSLFFVIFISVVATVHAKAPVDGATKLRVENSIGKLPLRFEKNEGQTSEQVKFLSRGSGYSMYFTPTESVMVLSRAIDALTPKAQSSDLMKSIQPAKTETSVVRMEVVGANKKAKITGQDKLPGTSNYFKGNDQSKWRQGVANYKKVHYEEVYPGIDLVYYGNQKKLEYDFVVKPGADPEKIELNFKGTNTLSIDEKGDLILETNTGNVIQRAPVIYQTIDGKKKSVEGRYVIQDNHNVAFKLAQYNPDHNLVIDPVIGFATYLGGSSTDKILDMAVDSVGNIYMTGWTVSPDFDVLNELEGPTADIDVIVVKLEQTGNVPTLAFSTLLGGTGGDGGGGIALDSTGNIYVTGSTTSTDFDMVNAIEGHSGGNDIIVFKLEQTNNVPSLAFSTYLGGSDYDSGKSIAVDSTGNFYVAGYSSSTDFDVLNEIEASSGDGDVIVLKFEQTNNVPSLAFSTYLGGSKGEYSIDIGLDGSANIYVAGVTKSADFDLKNSLKTSTGGNQFGNFFVFKLEQSGNQPSLAYSTKIGGSTFRAPSPYPPPDAFTAMVVDSTGNVYTTGHIYGSSIPLVNNIGETGNLNRFNSDAFVMKIGQANNQPFVAYSTRLGGSLVQRAYDIALDSAETPYISGKSYRGIFPQINPLPGIIGPGDFLVKLEDNSNVPNLVFSSYLGFDHPANIISDSRSYVAVDGSNNVYVATSTTDHTLSLLNEIEGFAGGTDIYAMKVVIGSSSDTTPPVVTAPVDVTAEATAFLSFPPIGTATATDDVSAPGDITITNNAPSTGFPLGRTVVVWTAQDEATNTATANQHVTVTDTTSPLFTLLGDNPINAEIGEPYIDPWAYAFDLVDGFVPFSVTSQVGAAPGTFEVVFSATDSRGNATTATRVVNPVDTTPPVITILGANPINASIGQPYVDSGATAVDSVEGSVSVTLTTQIGAAPGTFEVVYSASDSSGNTANATRVVVVVP